MTPRRVCVGLHNKYSFHYKCVTKYRITFIGGIVTNYVSYMDVAAAAASSTTTRPTFNLGFFTSPAGWFKIAEIILGILVFSLIASSTPWDSEPSQLQFVMFVSITSWILTLILAVMYMFAIQSTVLSGAPWDIIEFAFNAFWSLFYFIAAIVEATVAGGSSHLGASTFFCFFITAVYICHTLYAFKVWRGQFPWGSSGGGGEVNK